jgi:integrase
MSLKSIGLIMAVDRKIYTEPVDIGLKANKEFTKFYLNCKINGKIKQKVFDYTNKSWDKTTRKNKAKKDVIIFKESFNDKLDDIKDDIKLNEFIKEYFQTMEQSNSYSGNRWKNTIQSYYNKYIKNEIGNKKLDEIRQLHIKKIIAKIKDLGMSARTQKITLEILNPVFKSAIANRIIIYNPCDGIKVKRPNTRKKVQDASKLLKEVFIAIKTTFSDDIYFQALFMFALQGRRKSEILTLKWKNIDFRNKFYTIENTKNGEDQTFILPDMLESLLLAMKSNKNNYVFESPTDPTMHIQNIETQVNKLKKYLKKPEFGIHYLRNIVVSAMAEQGVDSTFLSGALGHSDLNTIKKYVSIPYKKGSEVANNTIIMITEN